ncbi:hypothetical protein PHSY_003130 [Pseudozyma hubeiensis SY62]|uniref:Uncharacterized protein n=1 Tax=Pseudozyma hubeiensis (strain SY62) TaxID=1305764 RepID=R9P2P9_PSEHS|nr:hypothetical protein PHSY_003130 [Pseudozyma hubeiensis SY62]GAC95554.1 hypothetical protein PHSY_003130 [Pseudozyma hubeiensis SY62]
MQPTTSAHSDAGASALATTRGFDTPSRDASAPTIGFSMPPSDSNASIWTTASASESGSGPQSKRASMIGFDIDAMRSVQPAHEAASSKHTIPSLQQPPRIGVQAPSYDSDGSHYDEDEMPGAFSHSAYDRSADRTIEAPVLQNSGTGAAAGADEPDEEEVFSNALPSPPVPRRTSSVIQDGSTISPSPSLSESIATARSRHAASRSSLGQPVSDQIPQRHSSADFGGDHARTGSAATSSRVSREDAPGRLDLSDSTSQTAPIKGAALQAVDEIASTDRESAGRRSHEPSLDEQKRIEQELLAEADESRPRTLKEARERARLRKQQGEAASPPSASATIQQPASATSSPRKGASLHMRDVASSATAVAAEESGARTSVDSRDRPMRNPRRMSQREAVLPSDRASLSERSAPSDYSHDSGLEGAFTYDEPAASSSHQHLAAPAANADQPATSIEDLTDAVDDAMNDLSFGDETLSADDEFATPMPPAKAQEEARPQLPTSLPSAKSLASITGAGPEAVRSSPLPSPARYAPQTPTKGHFLPAIHSNQSLATPPLGSPVHPRSAQSGYTPQRSATAPPSRIEVYGKTIPMPKSFNSSSINSDKRRQSSWDRARTYAQFTNELLHLETRLSLWMQVVQRPAQHQQTSRPIKQGDEWMAQGTLPRSMHVRNEGSYADSIRSDMTFPMRGDGAKAKEIVSVMPTMAESPVKEVVALPYPGVVQNQGQQQQPRSNSIVSFASIPASATAETLTASRSAGMGGNRLFGGLGRRGSKKTQPPAAVPASLTSAAAAAGGSRAYLANSRNRGVSPGGVVGSMPGARPSTDTFETSHSTQSQESPATSAVGLGLAAGAGAGATGAESSLAAPLRDAKSASSPLAAPTTTTHRAPMGPRAPNAMARTGSAQSVTPIAAPPTPITPITPITPLTGGFGSGPTFVSRLGGGSFSSGSHSTQHATGPRSPIPDYPSPDLLSAPNRRASDVSAASPTTSSNHDSSHPTSSTSPRLSGNAGLRSSLSYTSVRDRIRRGSSTDVEEDAGFREALVKLGDILPDADETTLRWYLKRAKGNDLAAIGDYLQDQSLGKLPRF